MYIDVAFEGRTRQKPTEMRPWYKLKPKSKLWVDIKSNYGRTKFGILGELWWILTTR